MGLIRAFVGSDLKRLDQAGVRVRVLGRRQGVPKDIVDIVDHAEAKTANNDKFTLQVAFNYGGRADLVDAAQAMVQRASTEGAFEVTEDMFGSMLSTNGSPPVDLIIRTSGEQRLSNFLLWECAYAELVFQEILWPDYGQEALADAIQQFGRRVRRFGGREALEAPVAVSLEAAS